MKRRNSRALCSRRLSRLFLRVLLVHNPRETREARAPEDAAPTLGHKGPAEPLDARRAPGPARVPRLRRVHADARAVVLGGGVPGDDGARGVDQVERAALALSGDREGNPRSRGRAQQPQLTAVCLDRRQDPGGAAGEREPVVVRGVQGVQPGRLHAALVVWRVRRVGRARGGEQQAERRGGAGRGGARAARGGGGAGGGGGAARGGEGEGGGAAGGGARDAQTRRGRRRRL